MSELERFDRKLAAVNQKCSAAGLTLKIERRGGTLGLRGTLPPKPGGDKEKPHQQRINLGVQATLQGLEDAKKILMIVHAQLISGCFDWNDYTRINGSQIKFNPQVPRPDQVKLATRRPANVKARNSLPAKIVAFEKRLLNGSNPISATTWQGVYMPYLKRLLLCARETNTLPPSQLIRVAIESYPINSRSRQLCFEVLASFCKSVGIEFPHGAISPETLVVHTPTIQALLSDNEILDFIASVSNAKWRYAFGLIAVYGLRNYEVFFCDVSKLNSGGNSIRVCQQINTSLEVPHQRCILPLHPDWVEIFQLRSGVLPAIAQRGTTLQKMGQRVTQQMRRYGARFAPKALREAWTARAINSGIPDTVVAEMLGCSHKFIQSKYKPLIAERDTEIKLTWENH